MSLRTDYKDAVFSGNRKYRVVENEDETVSFEDVTEYAQEGDAFGAKDINDTNKAVKELQEVADALGMQYVEVYTSQPESFNFGTDFADAIFVLIELRDAAGFATRKLLYPMTGKGQLDKFNQTQEVFDSLNEVWHSVGFGCDELDGSSAWLSLPPTSSSLSFDRMGYYKSAGGSSSSGGSSEAVEVVQTTAIDFSAWSDGSFKETLADGTEITYMVEFDESGQPTKISDGTTECAVTWEA